MGEGRKEKVRGSDKMQREEKLFRLEGDEVME